MTVILRMRGGVGGRLFWSKKRKRSTVNQLSSVETVDSADTEKFTKETNK